jgi:hypothetical protein
LISETNITWWKKIRFVEEYSISSQNRLDLKTYIKVNDLNYLCASALSK